MCGSGTLLIEAAQMEAQIAPQLHRLHWGFDCWKGHNQDAWDKGESRSNYSRLKLILIKIQNRIFMASISIIAY